MAKSRDIYIAIMVAAAKGRGLRLTADDVNDLSRDDAICQAAYNGLGADEANSFDSWDSINPNKPRVAANRG